jgi:hypothetical protein
MKRPPSVESQGERSVRLAHGWRLAAADVSKEIIEEFIRPAVRAIPPAIADRLGRCRVSLPSSMDEDETASRWTASEDMIEIAVATSGVEPHDVAMELLVCVGQALWDVIRPGRCDAWRELLCTELAEQVGGEIDEQARDAKRALLASRSVTRGRRRWEEYARASFASTAAEYVHCLWHDVTVRTGPEHLPAPCLLRRLELLATWFPPARGRRLFPARARRRSPV